MHRWWNRETLVAVALLAAAAFVYFHQLDSPHIPKNGDEYPYTHIVRETSLSGHWLPLRDQIGLDNTKPPLLFWQGIASTDWAEQWSMWRLRAPNVVYTLLIALMINVVVLRLSASRRAALAAAATYLAFFSTYHYGRPFVTDAGLTFWTLLAMSLFVAPGGFMARPSWMRIAAAGLCLGIAALYKSPAFVVPAVVGIYMLCRLARSAEGPARTGDEARLVVKLAAMSVLSGLVFSLWFFLDPNPGQVFESFVLRENLGKFDTEATQPQAVAAKSKAPWGVLFGLVLNAGLLAPVVVALVVSAVRRRKQATAVERGLWAAIIVAVLFFMLPSTRSGRYLLQVMPLLAILAGLAWSHLPTLAFRVSAGLVAIVQLVLLYLGWNWEANFGPEAHLPGVFWMAACCGVGLLVACSLSASTSRPAALALCLLAYLQFSSVLAPITSPLGEYSTEVRRVLEGQRVWVPSNFIAKHERYRFTLPGCEPVAYDPSAAPWTTNGTAAEANRYLVLQPRRDARLPDGSKVLATRLDIATRHTSAEIRQIVFEQRLDLLFQREYLLDLGAPR